MNQPEVQIAEMLSLITMALCTRTDIPDIRYDPGTNGDPGVFHVRVNGRDQGKMVGKKGGHIWAIYTLVWYASMAQTGKAVHTRLQEPEDEHRQMENLFEPKEDWSRQKIQQLIRSILDTCLKEHAIAFSLEETDRAEAKVRISIQEGLQKAMQEPNFEKAISTVLRAAGKSSGVVIETEVTWD